MSLYTDLTNWHVPIGGIRFRSLKPVTWHVGKKDSGFSVTVPTATSSTSRCQNICDG